MEHAVRYTAADEIGGIGGYLARLRQRWAEHRRYRATFAELEALSDRDLADMGLVRADIRAIARESVYGE